MNGEDRRCGRQLWPWLRAACGVAFLLGPVVGTSGAVGQELADREGPSHAAAVPSTS
jgi:hypothetical protein